MSILYHGGPQQVEFPEIRKTRYTKDFSWGFYCTNHYEQAKRRAVHARRPGFVSRYQYTPTADLLVLSFSTMTDEWLDFIAACRNGEVHGYDVVEGPMADDTIWDYVSAFIEGDISREAFWALAKFRYPTHQISFHTLRALHCLSFEGSDRIG